MRLLEEYGELVLQALAGYLEECKRGAGPVIRLRPVEELRAELELDRWIAGGKMTPSDLQVFLERYLAGTTRLHHPAYLGHQLAVPLLPSALADMVNSITANGMAVYEMGPTATAVDLAVLDWMLGLVGWDRAHAGGVLTHGGSLANLTCLAAAREARCPEVKRSGLTRPLALLAPTSAHYSVTRAAMLMGLGRDAVIEIPTDGLGVLAPEELPATLERARSSGREVIAVVASACATATGLYDPLEPVGRFCQEEGLWFHVDGAHGAAALLPEEERHLMRGVELADSLVWDAHKMLGTTALCTAALLCKGHLLERTFRSGASYLGGDREPQEGVDLIHRTVECTKWPLGLRLFLNLAFLGPEGLGQQVEGLFESTRQFHRLLQERGGYACPYVPQANILCFRLEREGLDQLELRRRLLREGNYYLTEALLRDRPHLRMVVMNPATDEATITGLLETLELLADKGTC